MTQFLFNGMCNGAVYAIVALGFGLVFYTTRVFHVAHGAVYVASAYVCHAMLVGMGLSLAVSFGGAVAAGAFMGIAIEALLYFPLTQARRKRPASSMVLMITSLGIYIVIVNLIALVSGNDTKLLHTGVDRTFSVFGAILTYSQLFELCAGILVLCSLALFFRLTRLGRALRALADDPELLSVLGLSVRRLRIAVFAIASVLASIGGVLAGLDVGIDPNAGFLVVLVAAVASILGGFGRLLAPALGAVLLALLQGVVVWLVSSRWSPAVAFGILILTLTFRPQGLLATKKRREEL